jgi:hypothetical protein
MFTRAALDWVWRKVSVMFGVTERSYAARIIPLVRF